MGPKGRKPNGVLGLLCREHYPGIVQYAGRHEPAYTFDHYSVAPDPDFPNKAARVRAELWVSLRQTISNSSYFFFNYCLASYCVCMQNYFKCEPGKEAVAEVTATRACRKLVTDMIYEARLQAIITYNATVLGTRVTKTQARVMTLGRAEFLQVSDFF